MRLLTLKIKNRPICGKVRGQTSQVHSSNPVQALTTHFLNIHIDTIFISPVAYPGMFFGGGSTNSVEDGENGDLGVVAP